VAHAVSFKKARLKESRVKEVKLKEARAKETGKTRNSENKKRYFINGLIFCDFKSIAPIIC
ncbi:hypothetical protein QT621_27695, partial [Xanthomonas citri pv. citri]